MEINESLFIVIHRSVTGRDHSILFYLLPHTLISSYDTVTDYVIPYAGR